MGQIYHVRPKEDVKETEKTDRPRKTEQVQPVRKTKSWRKQARDDKRKAEV